MRKLLSRPEGFTLIELMIVILIIAILVAIAVPVYLSAKKGAEQRTCQANIRTVDGAVEVYAAAHDNKFPTKVSELAAGTEPALKKEPTCPSKGGTTPYGFSGTPPELSCPNIADHTI